MHRLNNAFTWFTIILAVGFIFNLFILYDVYAKPEGDPSLCAFGENFDCGAVAKSPYANFDGIVYYANLIFDWNLPYPIFPIPNPIMLIIIFAGWIFLAFRYKADRGLFGLTARQIGYFLLATATFGVLYAAYLFHISWNVLETFCIFCLGLDIVMVSSLAILIYIFKRHPR